MVVTLAWNTTRHLESWFGIMGLGAVTHTVNPRLSDKDIMFIINDAEVWKGSCLSAVGPNLRNLLL